MTKISNFPLHMSKNEFLIEKYDKLRVDIKMYMSEISKFKISDLKAQKMIILWTMKHVSAIRKHPVFISVHYMGPIGVFLVQNRGLKGENSFKT